jgi:hypothetical protein
LYDLFTDFKGSLTACACHNPSNVYQAHDQDYQLRPLSVRHRLGPLNHKNSAFAERDTLSFNADEWL